MIEALQAPVDKWLGEDTFQGSVIDWLQTTLKLRDDRRVGGCNHYTGHAMIAGEWIALCPLAHMPLACAPAVMDLERKFSSPPSGRQIDSRAGHLARNGTNKNVLIRFAHMKR